MERISFDSTLPLIVFPVTVSDIDANVFRDVVMALDTGLPPLLFRQRLPLL